MEKSDLLGRSWRLALTASERRHGRKTVPGWVRGFNGAYRSEQTAPTAPSELINALLPLAESARRNVRSQLAASRMAPSQTSEFETLAGTIEANLFERLSGAACHVLVVELGAASERGLLTGDDPSDRFAFFCDCLADPKFSARLLAQYPALVRRLVAIVSHWEAASIAMLGRLSRDIGLIQTEIFGGKELGFLTGTESSGDSHAGGQSVQLLRFSAGHRVIYKPRPIAMERGFFDFVRWLNDAGSTPDLMAAFALERRSYGWVRAVESAPCPDDAAVRRFYVRQGANLAVAYLLGASDLHYENVIAAGEYPVIVDLETLFHVSRGTGDVRNATAVALRELNDSVYRSLLLPTRIAGDDLDGKGPRSADISALGYVGGQTGPFETQDWAQSGTDEMRLVEARGVMPLAKCLPERDGERIPYAAYVEDILHGFGGTYDFLHRHHKKLDAPNGPLNAFRGHVARHVFRHTPLYVQLLNRSWHPSYARNAKLLESDLRRHLSLRGLVTGPKRTLQDAEIADLFNGDVPYFRTKVGTRVAFSPMRPRSTIQLPFQGWNTWRRRIESLGAEDRERQIWLMKISFATPDAPLSKIDFARKFGSRQELKSAARRIGDRLCGLTITKGRKATWIYPMPSDDLHLIPATVDYDLYNGLAGIALFLGRLSCQSGNARYRDMAAAAMSEALSLYESEPTNAVALGGFEGAASLAYALALLARWLRRPAWARKSAEIVRAQARRAVNDPDLDVISGRAGLLSGGIAVAQILGDDSLLKRLAPCARALRRVTAKSLPKDEDAGIAHGKAGVGFALARWAHSAQEPSYMKRAKSLIEADLAVCEAARKKVGGKYSGGDGPSMIGWCRGGLGATLAALRLQIPVAPAAENLVRDIRTEYSKGADVRSLCMCHGLLGSLEFLEAARDANIPGADSAYKKLRCEAVGRVLGGELCCDHSHRLETPSLLLGLAGTGYALLRMLDPQRTPSILTLETDAGQTLSRI